MHTIQTTPTNLSGPRRLHLPAAPSSTMRHLIADLDEITAVMPDEHAPSRVAATLAGHLSCATLLGPAHLESSADRYRTNVVHVHPGGAYSIVALVWQPGQRTSIHSHRSWCVVGVYVGSEVERTFRWSDGQLVEHSRQRLDSGSVTWMTAGDHDIHDVANATKATTVSIHVYGLDYRTSGTSILNTHPEPITAERVA